MRDPDRKGKVESRVGHAQKTPLKGMRFESLVEAQAYLDRWEARCADTRSIGRLAGVQRFDVAALVKYMQGEFAAPTVKQYLAALRTLFDSFVTGHFLDMNPAHAVRGPKYVWTQQSRGIGPMRSFPSHPIGFPTHTAPEQP